jgi:hypothetical protein
MPQVENGTHEQAHMADMQHPTPHDTHPHLGELLMDGDQGVNHTGLQPSSTGDRTSVLMIMLSAPLQEGFHNTALGPLYDVPGLA